MISWLGIRCFCYCFALILLAPLCFFPRKTSFFCRPCLFWGGGGSGPNFGGLCFFSSFSSVFFPLSSLGVGLGLVSFLPPPSACRTAVATAGRSGAALYMPCCSFLSPLSARPAPLSLPFSFSFSFSFSLSPFLLHAPSQKS